MPIIHMLKGLPASGKSTIARVMVDTRGYVRVSKDDLRAMMHNNVYNSISEQFVIAARDELISLSIARGFDVIVDDTNLNPKHGKAMKELSVTLGAGLDVMFVDTPLDVCIERDAARPNPVGEAVIRKMYEDYIK